MNTIQTENTNTGTTAWSPSNGANAFNFSTQIQTYCDQLSYNAGDTVHFYASVQTATTSYTITIYRLGSYQLKGGTLKATVTNASGTAQGWWDETNQVLNSCPTSVLDSTTHRLEAGWTSTDSWTIPGGTTTGVYIAVFTDANNQKCACSFVVKGNATADYVVIRSEFTEAAYNTWGGYDIYQGLNGSQATIAQKVSFNRPNVLANGGSNLLLHEMAGIKWFENQGYNLSYLSQMDVHSNPSQLLNYKGIILLGHTEYWTKEFHDGIVAAVNAGVGLAVMGANASYWQVRMENSSTGTSNRTMTCYKVQSAGQPNYGAYASPQPLTNDPFYGVDNSRVTTLWLDPLLNQPEAALVGCQTVYGNKVGALETQNVGWTVDSSAGSNALLSGTGLVPGSTYGIDCVGYEWDTIVASSPANVQTIGTTNTGVQGASVANTTFYVAPSGARVFASGSIDWEHALDTYRWLTPSAGQTASGNRVAPQMQVLLANVMQQLLLGTSPKTYSTFTVHN